MKKGSSSIWYFLLFFSLALSLGGYTLWKNTWFKHLNESLEHVEEHYSTGIEFNSIFQTLTTKALLARDVPTEKKGFFDHTQKQIDAFKATFKEIKHFEMHSLKKPLEEIEKAFDAYYPFLLELAYYKKTGDHKNETDPDEITRIENLELKVSSQQRTIDELLQAVTKTFEKEQKENIEAAQHQMSDTGKSDLIWSLSLIFILLCIPFALNSRIFKPIRLVKMLADNIKKGKYSEKYSKQKAIAELKAIQDCLIDNSEKLLEGEKAASRVDFINNNVLRHSVILRRDLRIVNVGEKLAKLLGYTPTELESKPIATILNSSNQTLILNAESYENLKEFDCELARKSGIALPSAMVVKILKEDEKIKYIYLTMKPPKPLVKTDSEKKYLKAIDMLTASNMRLRQENEKLQQKMYTSTITTTDDQKMVPVNINEQISKWLERFMAESRQVFTSRTRFDATTGQVATNPDILHTALNRCAREILDKTQTPFLSVETGLIALNKEAHPNQPATGLFTTVIISAKNKPLNFASETSKPVNAKWAQNFSASQKDAAIYSNNNPNNLYYAILFENEALEQDEEVPAEIVIH